MKTMKIGECVNKRIFEIKMYLCLWFRAALICINCPMRHNTKQSIYYSASSLYNIHHQEYTKL